MFVFFLVAFLGFLVGLYLNYYDYYNNNIFNNPALAYQALEDNDDDEDEDNQANAKKRQSSKEFAHMTMRASEGQHQQKGQQGGAGGGEGDREPRNSVQDASHSLVNTLRYHNESEKANKSNNKRHPHRTVSI